jgi:hypothetical protein
LSLCACKSNGFFVVVRAGKCESEVEESSDGKKISLSLAGSGEEFQIILSVL